MLFPRAPVHVSTDHWDVNPDLFGHFSHHRHISCCCGVVTEKLRTIDLKIVGNSLVRYVSNQLRRRELPGK
jgi:hypothetical protein